VVIDKNGVLKKIHSGEPINIEIGVGDRKRDASAVGIDILDTPAADIVGDALSVLSALPDNSVASVFSEHVFEHLSNLDEVIKEIDRVLVQGGKMVIVVPHFSNPFYYSDPTHKTFFGLYTFSYFCDDKIFTRRVPRYVARPNLMLESVRLVFKTYRPRYIAFAWRKILQAIFNSSTFMQEMYEDSFSNIISCYEIEYRVKKNLNNERL
jgi:ubiquinone/menaquinone biosynthesis C-methylase UbiE